MPVAWLQRQWFSKRRLAPALWFLLPLHWLFVVVSTLRRRLVRPQPLPIPVVVVGNITVGGAGKTPLTLALVEGLHERGLRPGIVSRGYGRERSDVVAVSAVSSVSEAGDEPLLLARRSGAPVYVGSDRVAAARALLAAHPETDLILCDDGLQHYRLGRDAEIAVFDGRGAGNGWRLPVGPLREPLSRLENVDALVFNGSRDSRVESASLQAHCFDMRLVAQRFYRLEDPQRTCTAAELKGKTLRAVAGIGDPARFFRTLEGLGLVFSAHPFPDHYIYTAADLVVAPGEALLMTEKDAVKCAGLATGETWVLPVMADIPSALIDTILEKIRGRQAS